MAAFEDRRSVTVAAPLDGYVCDLRFDRATVVQYAVDAADDGPLDCYLLAHDALEPLLAGDAERAYVAATGRAASEVGPIALAPGRYAMVVLPSDGREATVTYRLTVQA